MTQEQGSMLPAFGGLMFVSLVILALAVEIASLGIAWRQTADLADVAAESAAAMIDRGALHVGAMILDEGAATAEALGVISTEGNGDVATVDVSAERVCVTVTHTHRATALNSVAIADVDVVVTSCAVPRTG